MDSYLDQAPGFCFSHREDGTLINVNGTLTERLGYSREELIGQKVDVLFTLPTRIFQQTHFAPLLKMQGHAEEIFISLQTKEREHVPVLINAARRLIAGEEQIIHVGIEVQNRKQFEEELIAAKKAAEKALSENTELIKARKELDEHMEALDQQIALVTRQNKELLQFNKVITHDLQEPVRKMSVFANMMLSDPEKARQHDILERLINTNARLRLITSGLQQYMWLTEASLEPRLLDTGKVLLSVREQLEAEFPTINLTVETGNFEPIVADETQLRILLYQLLSNVIRFRKKGENAIAKLSMHKLLLNKYRNIEGKYKYSEFLKLELADQGIGFNSDYSEGAFELFRRLHTESGSGIGLALCRKVAHNHHGEISITAREGQGTTVSVLLPATVASQVAQVGITD